MRHLTRLLAAGPPTPTPARRRRQPAPALVRPTLRAIRRAPILGALAAGLAVVAVPAATTVTLAPDNLAALLRLGMACAAIGLAFLFDDPAKPTTATAPAPAWHSLAIRTTTAIAAMASWWTAAVGITRAGAEDNTAATLPLSGLALEAATLATIAVAAAVITWRTTPRGIAGPAAAPAVLVAVAALAFAPRWASMFVSVTSPDWTAAHQRLAAVLTICLAATAIAATLPAIPRRPPRLFPARLRPPATNSTPPP